MTRNRYIRIAILGTVACAFAYTALCTWAFAVDPTYQCNSHNWVYCHSTPPGLAEAARLLVVLLGIGFSIGGGWFAAHIAQWISEDPKAVKSQPVVEKEKLTSANGREIFLLEDDSKSKLQIENYCFGYNILTLSGIISSQSFILDEEKGHALIDELIDLFCYPSRTA